MRRSESKILIQPYLFLNLWLLTAGAGLFLIYVCWHQNLLPELTSLDKSHLTHLIAAITFFASLHAAYHLVRQSRLYEAGRRLLTGTSMNNNAEKNIRIHVRNMLPSDHYDSSATMINYGFEQQADKFRAPIEIGSFVTNLLIRLGLVGTIIGFMLIFGSLDNLTDDNSKNVENMLIVISRGMGTALLTTLAGLLGAILLSLQYMLLNRQTEQLLGVMLKVRERWHSLAIPTRQD